MKRVIAGLIAVVFWVSNAAWANPMTDEERRLVSLAEEISTSAIDDDEKIARLTEIENRISRIRNNRTDVAKTASANAPSGTSAPTRPLSTFVENQTRSALEIGTDEEEPTLLSRFFFAAVRYVGITLAIGIAVIALSLMSTQARAYLERRFDWSEWPIFRHPRAPVTSVRNIGNPVVPTMNTPTPIRQTSARPVREKPAVTRDGMVPPHLR